MVVLFVSQSHDVVAAIDVEDVAGDGRGQRAAQKGGGVGHFQRRDAARQRRALGGVIFHFQPARRASQIAFIVQLSTFGLDTDTC